MNVRTSGMECATEMIVNSAKAGLRIAEVPTRLLRDGQDRPPHLINPQRIALQRAQVGL
jgi:hypothetical protein